MPISLEKQVAVVTGGSRGIGAATVKLFAESGCNVAFSHRRATKTAQGIEKSCGKTPSSATAIRADASKPADVRKLVDLVIRRFRRIDILVAIAGI